MSVQCITCHSSPGSNTAGSDVAEQPGRVWKERFELEKDTQTLMNSTPLMKLENGELKLDVSLLERISNSTSGGILKRFRDALESLGVYESATSAQDRAPADLKISGVGNKKEQRTEPQRSTTQKRRINLKELDWETSNSSSKKQKTEATEPVCENVRDNTPSPQSESTPERAESYDFLSRKVQFMTVPIGSSEKDRITLYDKSKRMLTRAYIDVPRAAYSGMQMDRIQPSSDFKLLLVDGDGFKVGGTTAVQHAVRLHVHRCKCMNAECNVLGCGSDPSFSIFKNAACPDMVKSYARHWASSNRQALRAHGQSLQVRAGITH